MIELRSDQRTTVDKGLVILRRYNLLYMACEVRTGKSVMSMTIAKEIGWRNVAFITKKKAISSIELDYQKLGHIFNKFTVINYESVGKLHPIYDGYICDEATSLAAFPKPGKYCQLVKKLIGKKPVILMSGTPTPESPSQIFHQFWVSYYSPFSIFANFYKWAKEYVKQYEIKDARGKVIKKQVKQIYIRGIPFSDYSEGLEDKIKEITKHYTVTLSQQEAGFTSFVDEEILWVDIDKRLYDLMKVLKKDKVYRLKSNGEYLLADGPAQLQQLCHQISSGTAITSSKKRVTLDESKVWFIKNRFAGQKIAIYYKFIQEGELLRRIFPNHTDVPEEFNSRTDCTFICQMVSGRMGLNLSTADALVMYNIDFSATTYFQVRARMQKQDRTKASKLYWIFSRHGLEKFVYKAVCAKKDFTLDYFRQASKTLFE